MIYVIWGKDSLNIQLSLQKIIHGREKARLVNIEEANLATFANEALTESFFNETKILVAHDLAAKMLKEKKSPKLVEILKKMDPQNTVVLVESTEPKAPLKLFFQKNAQLINHERVQARDIIEFIKKRTEELDSQISPLAAERLATFVGPEYWQLEEELKKLTLYKKGNDLDPVIEVADVDELVRAGFEANIFELMDAISQKNTNRAITLLDSFLDSGENEIYILTMIARQFRNIAMAKIEGMNEATLAKRAGIHPFVAKQSIQQSQNFSPNEISDIYGQIVAADLALKSGGNAKQALQGIIVNN